MMLDHQGDLDSLKEKLYVDCPAIKELTFQLAINTELINFNKELNDARTRVGKYDTLPSFCT